MEALKTVPTRQEAIEVMKIAIVNLQTEMERDALDRSDATLLGACELLKQACGDVVFRIKKDRER